jgi:hypothetical protein
VNSRFPWCKQKTPPPENDSGGGVSKERNVY